MNKKLFTVFVLVFSQLGEGNTPSRIREDNVQPSSTIDTKVNDEQVRRKLWGLNKTEWKRYKELMMGMRGSISPSTVSPIEVLGVHAKTDVERKKYAEIWARKMHEDADRIIAFQNAYDEADKRLYGNQPVIDFKKLKKKLILGSQQSGYTPQDRVVIFIKTAKCLQCGPAVKKILSDERLLNNQIDIYFIDTSAEKDDKKIRNWAVREEIPKQRLKTGRLTLNHDNGNLFKFTKKIINELPKAYKINGNSIVQINI